MDMKAQFVIPVIVSILILVGLGLSQNAFSMIDPPTLLSNPTGLRDNFALIEDSQTVGISGDKIIVGASLAPSGGAAYLFDVTDGSLLLTIPNTPSSAQSLDKFGRSVAMDGNKIVIGSPHETFTIPGVGFGTFGAAYLYDATTGNLLQTLINPLPSPLDNFGDAVAILGDKVVVAATSEDIDGNGIGLVYLFDATDGSLLQTFHDPLIDGFGSHSFGNAVAISGDKVVIGSRTAGQGNSGAVYIFDTMSGNLLHTLENPHPFFSHFAINFGTSLSISDNNVLVGAPVNENRVGTAYLFDATDGSLLKTFPNPNPDLSDQFGMSVSISGDCSLVAAIRDDIAGTSAGTVYLFSADGSLLETFTHPTPGFIFGSSLFFDGTNFVAGAINDYSGTLVDEAYFFKLPDTDGDGITDVCDNAPPDAINDSPETLANISVDIDVLANDTDPDGDSLSIDSTSNGPSNGSVAIVGDVITYTPNTDFVGFDSFDYTISDGNGGIDTATVTITVLSPQDGSEDIINDIEDFVDSGILNNGQGNSMIQKLNNIIDKLNNGQTNAACNQLDAFINQVNDFVNSGTLTPTEGQALIDAAQSIQVSTGC